MSQQSILNPTAYLNGKPITRELILDLIERHDFIYSQAMLFDYLLRLKTVSSQKKAIGFNHVLSWQIMSKSQWNNRRQETFLKYGFDREILTNKQEVKNKKQEVKTLLQEQMIEDVLSKLELEENN